MDGLRWYKYYHFVNEYPNIFGRNLDLKKIIRSSSSGLSGVDTVGLRWRHRLPRAYLSLCCAGLVTLSKYHIWIVFGNRLVSNFCFKS